MRELLGALDSHELTEWTAFDVVEPIGGRRGDIQAAVVASTVANIWRKQGSSAFEPADFIPDYGAGVGEEKPATDYAAIVGYLTTMGYMHESGEAAPQGDDPDAHD